MSYDGKGGGRLRQTKKTKKINKLNEDEGDGKKLRM